MATGKKGKVYIGTCGWSYPHWAKGVFYPKSVPTQDWLKYYSSVFSAVEVNSSFYRLPNPELLRKWATITPAEFKFSVKIWRRISHELRLKNTQQEIKTFHEVVCPLKEKTGAYLLQMPPSFVPDIELLNEFFNNWFSLFKDTLLALELRNKKGFKEEIFEVLHRYNVSLCLEDYRGCEIDNITTADWVYIRKHGASGRYQGEYDIKTLQTEAEKVKQWQKSKTNIFIFFNNDFGGYAPKNALQLMELLNKSSKKLVH